jgi:phosphate transport system substrate-binding protein
LICGSSIANSTGQIAFTQQAISILFGFTKDVNSSLVTGANAWITTSAITAGVVTGNNVFASSSVAAGATKVDVYVRESGSGTQQAMDAWATNGTGSDAPTGLGTVETSNQAMLAAVQGDPVGIGTVDYGIATTNEIVKTGISIVGIIESDGVTVSEPAVATGNSGAAIETNILNALKAMSSSTASQLCYPLNFAVGNNEMARTFWYLTNGQPNSIEQSFIDFATSPAQMGAWTSAGYYSLYSFLPSK